MNISFKGIEIGINDSWENFWQEDTKTMVAAIQNKIDTPFTPGAENVFRFFRLDLATIKVVILGQDPYPQKDFATGRAFEVANINDWLDTKINPSLKNIVKLLHKTFCDKTSVKSIVNVRKDITNGKFKVAQPNQLFEKWEKQGVLLINTALTCAEGGSEKSNTHSGYWHSFTKKLLAYISKTNPNLKWFLWGKHARLFAQKTKIKGKLFESAHPRRYQQDPQSFLKCSHFAEVQSIDWLSVSE